MSYDNEKQVIISKVVSDNPKAPKMRVEVVIDGVKHSAGMWIWERKDGSKVVDKAGNGKYIGRLEVDTYEAQQDKQGMQQARQAAQPIPDDFEDSDLPF